MHASSLLHTYILLLTTIVSQSAHKSILTLFEGAKLGHHCSLSPDNSFINIHGTLFTASLDNFYDAVEQLLAVLDKHIGRITAHSYKLS